jgi:UDPglucose--hexose-1-phosphate uridylyltransferase
MNELRQNIITRDWVIIAKGRAERPDEFAPTKKERIELPAFDARCPFCVGNEHKTLDETFAIRDGNGWRVRVVPNKFAALSPQGRRIRKVSGVFRSMPAVGIQEVIIEHPLHNASLALIPAAHVADLLRAYRNRYDAVRKDDRIEAVIIFKNHGEAAGTTLHHPHSQLVATPIVPNQFRIRVDESIRYFDDTGECVYCRTVAEELSSRERVIEENERFVAFIPYAALSPFHLWIFPKQHASSFDEISEAEIESLAQMLKTVLARLHLALDNPDYNYSIRSIPTGERRTDYFHWYITIIPRISKTAGFEYGSGMFINTAVPEESAALLRSVDISRL